MRRTEVLALVVVVVVAVVVPWAPAQSSPDHETLGSVEDPATPGSSSLSGSVRALVEHSGPDPGALFNVQRMHAPSSSSSGVALVVQAYRPLFSPDTAPAALPGLIRAVAALMESHACLRHAAESVSVPDAVFLFGRIADGQYADAVKAGLLGLLLSRFDAGVFFPLIVSELVRVDNGGRRARARLPIGLVRDLPDLKIRAGADDIPPEIVDRVRAITQAIPPALQLGASALFPAADVDKVRAQLPPPFGAVFPYNQYVARRLAAALHAVPIRARYAVVRALLRYGIRFDLLDLLGLARSPLDPDLLRILELGHPRRHLFDRMRFDGDYGGDLRRALSVSGGRVQDVVGVFDRFSSYLPVLYRSNAFVDVLRRRPLQLHAAASQMPFGQLAVLARQRFLAYPEFRQLANDLLRALVLGQVRAAADAADPSLQRLVVLPHVDLYAPLPGNRALLAYLCERPRTFRGLLLGPELLQRIVEDRVGFRRHLRRIRAGDRALIVDFVRRHRRHALIGIIWNDIGWVWRAWAGVRRYCRWVTRSRPSP